MLLLVLWLKHIFNSHMCYKCLLQPHLDGPLYFPVIATLNLGAHTVLNYYKNSDRVKIAFSLFLESRFFFLFHFEWNNMILTSVSHFRSLLLQQDQMYNEYMHGILEKEEDTIDETIVNLNKSSSLMGSSVPRKTRISLTIRHVIKTKKIQIKLSR